SLAGGDPISAIISSITVSREARDTTSPTNILNLTCRTTDPNDCPRILNAVIKSYKQYLNKEYETINENMIKEIHKVVDILTKDIERLKKEQIEFREKERVLFKGAVTFNPHQERLIQYDTELATLEARRI